VGLTRSAGAALQRAAARKDTAASVGEWKPA
jgi:hypothetical protein